MVASTARQVEWREKDFHISELIHAREAEASAAKLHETDPMHFKGLCKQVIKHLQEKMKARKEADIQKWQKLQHDAVIGKKEAVRIFKEEIEEFVRLSQLQGTSYPRYYKSLTEALFQETLGLGPISLWWAHPLFHKSEAAKIIGTKIYFDIPGESDPLQPFEYESEEYVIENVINKIKMKDEHAHINQFKPTLELEMDDGTRVTMIIPPRARKPMVIFRNYTMRNPRIEHYVGLGSMPADIYAFVLALSKARLNAVNTGAPKSGKSTFTIAMSAERIKKGKVTVVIEHDFSELKLSDLHPDHQILEFIVRTEADYDDVFRQVLRSDYDFAIIPELRSIEAELCMLACERGKGGTITTYHTEQVENIPGQIARLILQRFPSRLYEEELIRVAGNLDIGFVWRERSDGSKQLCQISEFRVDPFTNEISTHDFMRYDDCTEQYTFSAGVSDAIRKKMFEQDPLLATTALRELEELARAFPLQGQPSAQHKEELTHVPVI
ncbi:ATPase, T2SS/T4P/T4SS family [Paenibacillus algorifonticola]|uniref:ATPase, T2SS/T4P/T4SS family n=1 Tax=Paenibacillus algorifonticola TaxID=684063 RepID=UPI003D2C1CDF